MTSTIYTERTTIDPGLVPDRGAPAPTPDALPSRAEVARPTASEAGGLTTSQTVLPRQTDHITGPQTRRSTGRFSPQDALRAVGVAASSIATTMLIFGRLTSLSGRLGFAVVGFVVFLATHAVLASLTENRPAVIDKVMSALMTSAAVSAGFALFSVILFTFIKGWSALTKPNFYVEDLSVTGSLQPLSEGGVLHAVVGSLIMISLALVFTVPLAVMCAVFMNETKSRAASMVRTVVTAMTALPSILAGLFIFATWILILGKRWSFFQRSGRAAAVAISIMMLPIIIRSADVVLRLVPGNLREAAAALGAPQWRTVWHVVLPTARSGLTTSVILGVARGVGETAPVLLTAGVAQTMNKNPFEGGMMSLPLEAFLLVKQPDPTQIARGFGAAAVLMMLVLLLFTMARIVGGRPAGRLSKSQARRSANRSAADLQRIDGRRQLIQHNSPQQRPQQTAPQQATRRLRARLRGEPQHEVTQ